MKNLEYKLCYIDGNKAWFTSDFENQWGDDWDDKPYEHNAGEPYIYDYKQPEQGVKNGVGIYPEIPMKILYFELPRYWLYLPCDKFVNSPYSVKDINRGAIAWIHTDDFIIPAGTLIEDFIKTIESHGGNIYLLKEE